IGADHLGGVDLAVVGRDLDRLCMVDHVVIGDGIAVSGNEEPGADTGDHLMALHVALRAVLAKLPEEFLKGRARGEWGRFLIVRSTLIRISALIDPNAYRNHGGFHLRDEIGKAGLSGRICRYRCRRRGKGLSGEPSVSERSANGE